VAVRPEKLRLNSQVNDGNNLAGRVEDVIYIGTDTQYGIRFAGVGHNDLGVQAVEAAKQFIGER